jgi:hypothetical protein
MLSKSHQTQKDNKNIYIYIYIFFFFFNVYIYINAESFSEWLGSFSTCGDGSPRELLLQILALLPVLRKALSSAWHPAKALAQVSSFTLACFGYAQPPSCFNHYLWPPSLRFFLPTGL